PKGYDAAPRRQSVALNPSKTMAGALAFGAEAGAPSLLARDGALAAMTGDLRLRPPAAAHGGRAASTGDEEWIQILPPHLASRSESDGCCPSGAGSSSVGTTRRWDTAPGIHR